jgi:2-oxoglutarate ferredoxin oxidoreductase subunit alpha
MQSRWGTHGDHPIIVLSPSSVAETFHLTVQAFNLSEKYRTPVILLMDEVIAHMREKVELPAAEMVDVTERIGTDVPPEWYFPYDETTSDVPPMVSFGQGYRYHMTGLMHDRAGFPTLRLDEINPWLTRVFRKIERGLGEIVMTEEEWTKGARTVVVAYGCTVRSARHAVRMARDRRYKVGLVKLLTIWPFAEEVLEQVAHTARRIIVPELNRGQLALEVERVVGRRKVRRVNRADGEMLTPKQILAAIEEK